MGLWRTSAAADCAVHRDHLRAVGNVKSAHGAVTTYDAVWQDWPNTVFRHSGGYCRCRRRRNFRLWLLGASAASDYDLILRCFRSLVCMPLEARSSRL